MTALTCLLGRLRRALRPVEETPQERILAGAIERNIAAAQRGARAAQALEEVTTLMKDHAHAGRR